MHIKAHIVDRAFSTCSQNSKCISSKNWWIGKWIDKRLSNSSQNKKLLDKWPKQIMMRIFFGKWTKSNQWLAAKSNRWVISEIRVKVIRGDKTCSEFLLSILSLQSIVLSVVSIIIYVRKWVFRMPALWISPHQPLSPQTRPQTPQSEKAISTSPRLVWSAEDKLLLRIYHRPHPCKVRTTKHS